MDRIDKSILEYNAIYENVLKIVFEKLSNLNSYERTRVGGNDIYYKGIKPSMHVLHRVNKRINELNIKKESSK